MQVIQVRTLYPKSRTGWVCPFVTMVLDGQRHPGRLWNAPGTLQKLGWLNCVSLMSKTRGCIPQSWTTVKQIGFSFNETKHARSICLHGCMHVPC